MWEKYKKIPVEVEAIQFTFENKQQVFNDITCNKTPKFDMNDNPILVLDVPEGSINVALNDWIIKDNKMYSSYKPIMFEKMFTKKI